MMAVCPRFAALVDQVFFVLLRLFALVPRCFLVYVVRVVFVDLAKPLHCMLIDQLVVLIQGFLPFLLSGIMKCLGSFPGCQGRISLAATKLRFVSRSIRCSGVSADVQDCDPGEVLWCQLIKDVLEWASAFGLMPCFPDRGKLDNDFDLVFSVFGQGNKSC